MNHNKPKISVVIPAYNEEKYLPACLASLKQQTFKDFEVIVVDNNSTDKTVSEAALFQKRLNLRIILERKKGRGLARNTGFKSAQGEVIFSTDADTILPANWIEVMSYHLQDKKTIAVSGPCRINDCSWLKNTIFNLLQPTVMILYRLVFGHFWLTGSNFAIKKSVYVRSGGFNPQLNALEDIELGFKICRIGKIKFISSLPVQSSGRRFKQGYIKNLLAYPGVFFWFLLSQKQKAGLSDAR